MAGAALVLVGLAPLLAYGQSAEASAAPSPHLGRAVSPHKGIVPPKNPSKSLSPDPYFMDNSACTGADDDAACNKIVLSAIANARKKLEKLSPISFSTKTLTAYEKLSPTEQLFVTVNLERTARGLPAVAEMTKKLDTIAQAGAKAGKDPVVDNLPSTLPGGGYIIDATANFAGGFVNPLGSDYGWMYDDGPDSPNGDCKKSGAKGCWGHRDDILHTYETAKICDEYVGNKKGETVMGAGYLKGKGTKYGDSETELFVGVCGAMPTGAVLTWSKAESLLGIH